MKNEFELFSFVNGSKIGIIRFGCGLKRFSPRLNVTDFGDLIRDEDWSDFFKFDKRLLVDEKSFDNDELTFSRIFSFNFFDFICSSSSSSSSSQSDLLGSIGIILQKEKFWLKKNNQW